MTLQDVIDAPNATIRANALKIAAHTINGTDTTSLVILDLEYPIQYNEMWFYNDSLLAAIVGAVRRRVQITQTIFPRAPIALYDEHAQLNATVLEGYRRASALGLWDDVALLIPVLYMGGARFENATNRTIEVLTATAGHKTTSRGAAIPMAPVASWLYFPNQCAMPFAVAHEILATIERLSYTLPPQPTPFPIVHFWSGKDNETSQASEGPAVRRAADGAARLARGRANRAEAVPVVSPRPLSAVRIESTRATRSQRSGRARALTSQRGVHTRGQGGCVRPGLHAQLEPLDVRRGVVFVRRQFRGSLQRQILAATRCQSAASFARPLKQILSSSISSRWKPAPIVSWKASGSARRRMSCTAAPTP